MENFTLHKWKLYHVTHVEIVTGYRCEQLRKLHMQITSEKLRENK